MTVQFNIDSRHNEDARFKKVLFGYDGELLEVELNELQDILYAKLSEVVDNVFGTRPLFVGTYTLASNVLTIANEVVIGNRELILLTSSSITVASGDTIYLNIQDKTFTKADSIKKYGDQGSNTTVTNYIQDSRITDETTRRIQTTYQLVKNTSNPGVNIQLCTISGSTVNKQATSAFADSSLYKEIRRLATEQITASGVQVNQNAFSNVVVGGTTIAADTQTDTLTLAAGTAVTLTPNATTDTVTIAVNNATSSADGSMPHTDKAKLDAINQTLATTSSPSFVAMTSTAATGTAPLTVASTTAVTNLNADMVDGFHLNQDVRNTASPSFSKMTSTVTTGTAPLTVSSTTKVANLNVDQVDGFDLDQSVKTTDSPSFAGMTVNGMPRVSKTGGVALSLTQTDYDATVAIGTGNAPYNYVAFNDKSGNWKAYTGFSSAIDGVFHVENTLGDIKLNATGTGAQITAGQNIQAPTLQSTAATGTAPLTVASTTKVTNLNADKVDGYDFNQSLQTTDSPTFSKMTSTVATGTAPLTVTSTTKVANLNADQVDGYNFNQSLQTTDSPSFSKMTSTVATGTAPLTVTSTTKVANLNADQVDGFDLDQSVKTTDSPKFANVTATGDYKMTASDGTTKSVATTYAQDASGYGLAISGGGLTVVGGGESHSTYMTAQTSFGTENLVLTADASVLIIPNLQSGISSGKIFTFDASGNLTTPGNISAGGIITSEAFNNLVLQNGWTVDTTSLGTPMAARYRKLPNGDVQLSGSIKGGTTTQGTAIATLPVGYRPAQNYGVVVPCHNGSTFSAGLIYVYTDGTIQSIVLNNYWVRLDGIIIPTV